MCRFIVTILIMTTMLSSHAQDLGFNINGIFNKPVTQGQLVNAKSLKDINPGFPASWIGNYESVKLMLISGTDTVATKSYNDKLSSEQKTLLAKLDLGAKVAVEVIYTPKSNSLDGVAVKTIYFTYTVAPEKEAEFDGGYTGLRTYMNEKALSKINTLVYHQMQTAIIKFTINEEGNTVDAHIDQSTKNVEVDQLLLDAVCNMPKWKPAKNRLGERISQKFQFRAGVDVGC